MISKQEQEKFLKDEKFQELINKLNVENNLRFEFVDTDENPDVFGYMYDQYDNIKYKICFGLNPQAIEEPKWDGEAALRKLTDAIDKFDYEQVRMHDTYYDSKINNNRPFYHRFDNNRPKKRK